MPDMSNRSPDILSAVAPLASWPAPARHALCMFLIALLLASGTGIVYFTGGTIYAYPYLMLVPVILGAACYHTYGGIAVAVIAGLLMGPQMPLNVDQQVMQQASNWLLRLGLYVAIGSFTGALFGRLAAVLQARESAMRMAGFGLLNQMALNNDLHNALVRSAKTERPVVLVLVQVADFAEILSGIGADAGDELMEALGHNLCKAMTDMGQVYRLGASELVIMHEHHREEALQRVLSRIAAVGEESVVVHDVPVRAQLVAGITHAQGTQCGPQELIRRVRVAAFEALEQHQPYCHYATEYERDTAETIRLVAQVRRALSAGEFELHYQPKIRLSDGAVCGCEALIRWREGKNKMIPPGLFMPKVERTTLITPVTRFVTMQALEFLQNRRSMPVSINFAVSNLFDQNLLQWIVQLVHDKVIEPETLEVEITEGAVIRDPEAAKRAIHRLKGAGVCVLLDDFGTGYSSFEHLRHLPISGLKIDRAFVKDLDTDPRARKLMACMIDVAHALGVSVTAEGVETAAQAEWLRQLGCDLAQGYYYAYPMPAREYQRWLDRYENSTADHA